MWIHGIFGLSLLCTIGCAAENVDIDLSVDHSDWKDPTDPFASYQKEHQNVELLAACEQKLQQCLRNNKDETSLMVQGHHSQQKSDPAMKLLIRNLISRLNFDIDTVNYVDRVAQIQFTSEDLATIRRYLKSSSESISLREQVKIILENFIVQLDPYKEPTIGMRFVLLVTPYLPLLNFVILIPALLIILKNRCSTNSFLFICFTTAFLVSLFFVYNRKYQENVAARIARSKVNVADHCKPTGLLSQTFKVFRNLLFIQQQKSDCLQYHEDLFVDPLYEISPLDVISDVLSNFIFTPLGIFGRHYNTFITEFYRDTPLPLVLIKTLLFIFLVVMIFFWLCGYRLRTIFATLEPAGAAPYHQQIQPQQPHYTISHHYDHISLPNPVTSPPRHLTERPYQNLSNRVEAKPETNLPSRQHQNHCPNDVTRVNETTVIQESNVLPHSSRSGTMLTRRNRHRSTSSSSEKRSRSVGRIPY